MNTFIAMRGFSLISSNIHTRFSLFLPFSYSRVGVGREWEWEWGYKFLKENSLQARAVSEEQSKR